MKRRKGFSLIELLGAITILGILSIITIMSVSRVIERSKKAQKEEQEKTIVMATESYMQDHKSEMPKVIGETTTISISVLKNNKYIKEDIKNGDGKSCMEHSNVTVYKQSKDKYIYTPHLYCGDEVPPAEEQAPIPTISILFTDASGEENANVFENVSEAKIVITITGGRDANNHLIPIDGYSYSISTSTHDSMDVKEVYNSGTLSGGGETEITLEKPLRDYIDVTTSSHVYVKATVRNNKGGILDETVSTEDSSGQATYQDTTNPICVSIDNQAKNDTDWVNVYSTKKSRKITATCSDGDGSGCIRDTFTRTWPNKYQTSSEYGYIQVQDNAKNVNIATNYITSDPCSLAFTENTCRVRVNVDLVRPTITINAYKRDVNGNATGGSIFNGAVTTSTENETVQFNQYKDLVNNWMNKDNYPNGIIITVTITDDLHLASYKWETNPKNINKKSDSNYNSFSTGHPEGIPEVKYPEPNLSTTNCGSRSESFNLTLTSEGMRQGRLTVKDKAGNDTIFIIQADMDRTVPRKAVTRGYKKGSGNATSSSGLSGYSSGSWLSGYVFTQGEDATDALSGGVYYRYTTSGACGSNSNKKGNYFNVNSEGTSTVKFRSCDTAGNCGDFSGDFTVNLDRTGPYCTVTKTNAGSLDGVDGTAFCHDSLVGCCGSAKEEDHCDRAGGTRNFSKLTSTTKYRMNDGLGNTSICTVTITTTTYWRQKTRSCNTWARCSEAGCETLSGWSGWRCTNTWTNAPYGECYDGLADCAGAESGFYAYNCRTRYCALHNRSPICGCSVYSAWSDWSDYDYLSCVNGNYKKCESHPRYF